MTPMQIFDGSSTDQETHGRARRVAENRLANLALAVRQHEDTTGRLIASGDRPQDRRLYTRLRQVCGEPSGR
jgi:hypothetical protein